LDNQSACADSIQAVDNGLISAGDDTADKRGVVLDVDNEPAIPSLQPSLFSGRLEVAVHPALRDVSGNAAAAVAIDADTGVDARALLLGLIGAGVLQRLDAQVVAH